MTRNEKCTSRLWPLCRIGARPVHPEPVREPVVELLRGTALALQADQLLQCSRPVLVHPKQSLAAARLTRRQRGARRLRKKCSSRVRFANRLIGRRSLNERCGTSGLRGRLISR